jgi:hypothetical protein
MSTNQHRTVATLFQTQDSSSDHLSEMWKAMRDQDSCQQTNNFVAQKRFSEKSNAKGKPVFYNLIQKGAEI